MHKRRNILLAIVSTLAVAACAYFYFRKDSKESQSWRTEKVERGDVKIEVTATGTLSALTTVHVGTQGGAAEPYRSHAV